MVNHRKLLIDSCTIVILLAKNLVNGSDSNNRLLLKVDNLLIVYQKAIDCSLTLH